MTPAAPGSRRATLANLCEFYTSSEPSVCFGNSLSFASGAAVLSLVIGTMLAWLNERTNTPFKSLVYALSVVRWSFPASSFVHRMDHAGQPQDRVLKPAVGSAAFDTTASFFDVYTFPELMWVDGIQQRPCFPLMSAASAPWIPRWKNRR